MKVANNALTPERRVQITRALKHCSPETVEAALNFHETRSFADVSPVILGLINRETAGDSELNLATAPGSTRLIEDAGLDSLGLMEVVLAVEEVFEITVENEELRSISTLSDLQEFMRAKLSAATA